ncbi:MAG: hypothetical protein CL811_06385 [Colwelliaceae bacterium]|jgi:hypothetical protein|nr:hypothetical protein [Colwelliaceae bacterium]|tara:strand:- start:448 stop:711 length:264 start_codon:yes stop_codon:yes gene_type:complete
MKHYDSALEERLMIEEEDFVIHLSGSIRGYIKEIAERQVKLAQLEHMYRRYTIMREYRDLEFFTDPKGEFLYFREISDEPPTEEDIV